MDMEMADYERLVKELNSKIAEKDTHIEDLETQLLTQKNKEENLNEEIGETLSNLRIHYWTFSLNGLSIYEVCICQENIAVKIGYVTWTWDQKLFIMCLIHSTLSMAPLESLKSQLDQGEEKSSKMKQLLVKTKKDLADAKKNVSCTHSYAFQ